MSLSSKARYRLIVATTSKPIGEEIADAISDSASLNTITEIHQTVITAAHKGWQPARQPLPVQIGTGPVLGDNYTVSGGEEGFQVFKIPDNYVSGLAFHIHWTKNENTNQSGHTAKWEVVHRIVDEGFDLNAIDGTNTIQVTYLDTGTTSRIEMHTEHVDISTFAAAGRYLWLKIKAIAPTGTALPAGPLLLSLDVTYAGYLNK